MRVDIKEARATLRQIVKNLGLNPDYSQTVYNLAIKAYLKGYKQALVNALKESTGAQE
jgi:hypothetical protein